MVEADPALRKGLCALLDGTPGFARVSTHRSASRALDDLPAAKPEVVLFSLSAGSLSEIECIYRLRQKMPELQVVALAAADGPHLFDLLKAGVAACLIKPVPVAEILEAIEVVHRGGGWMTPGVAREVLRYFEQLEPERDCDHPLSSREIEVLHLARRGLSCKEIAAEMGVSYDTVRTHFCNIYHHLGSHSRAEALAKYFHYT